MSWTRIGFVAGLTLAAVVGWTPAEAQRRANLSLDAGEIGRGSKSTVTVNLSANREITLRRLSVRVRGKEVVDLTHFVPEEKDSNGKQIFPSRRIQVQKEEVVFEKVFTIVAGQELPAGSHHKFSGDIEIPAHLPPSYKGRYSSIRWEAMAETDMPGGFLGIDPSTSWQEISVK